MIELFAAVFVIALISVKLIELIEKRNGFVSMDYVKKKVFLPRSAGIALLFPLWLAGIYFFVLSNKIEVLAWLALISLYSLIGFFDDLKSKWSHRTLSWISRAMPIALVALAFSFFYSLGILWVVPLALFIAALASFHNTFAGLNGWETGSSFIISIALLFFLKDSALSGLGVALSASILALLLFNKFPARVFPGDSGTLLIGSGIAGLIVLTQDIRLAVAGLLLYLPHMLDYFVLKRMLSKAGDATQRKIIPYKLLKDGRIYIADYPKGRIQWDFAKMILRFFGPLREWKVSLLIWLIVGLDAFLVVYFFA
jgi:UDP-N-acetylglucosamine--dolichyl-phosphate N-acetylglucosaminephosphotransferase